MIKDAFFARPLVPEVQQKAEFWRQIERLAATIRRHRVYTGVGWLLGETEEEI